MIRIIGGYVGMIGTHKGIGAKSIPACNLNPIGTLKYLDYGFESIIRRSPICSIFYLLKGDYAPYFSPTTSSAKLRNAPLGLCQDSSHLAQHGIRV